MAAFRIGKMNEENFWNFARKELKIDVDEVGISKPEKGIFEELVRQAGCEAHEIIYADDNEGSYQSALSVGINAFLYTDFEDFKKNCLRSWA